LRDIDEKVCRLGVTEAAATRSTESRCLELSELLMRRRQRLVCAESCTGGLLAANCTAVPGSSDWFEAAFVTYSLSAKQRMLGVSESVLQAHGPVSEPVARAMAEGALLRTTADVSVAITGVAGPGGGEPMLPVGTVWFAWAVRGETFTSTARHQIAGHREVVRSIAVDVALDGLLQILMQRPSFLA
jgi:nicotinamide-nucleotide amidase